MCATCQRGYQEIRNLFNHANMRAEITNIIRNFYIAYVRFAWTPLPPLACYHTFLGYSSPALPSCSIHNFWMTPYLFLKHGNFSHKNHIQLHYLLVERCQLLKPISLRIWHIHELEVALSGNTIHKIVTRSFQTSHLKNW